MKPILSGLSPILLAQLVGVAVLLAFGQLLFKKGATAAPLVKDFSTLVGLFLNPTIIAAVALYGLTTALWVYTLQQVPLSKAYPFMALGFILVPLAAALVFHEPLSLRWGAGLVLILAGLWLSGASG